MKNIDIGKLIECCERRSRQQFTFAAEYAEPGYTDSERGIVFGDWNPACGFSVPKAEQKRDAVTKLGRVLGRLGFELEWEDEWTTCAQCSKAIRTSPDSYGWTPFWRETEDGCVCLDCLDPVEYLASIEDNPNKACAPQHDPEQHGYVKFNGDFETGFHEHQTDDPKKTLKVMRAQGLRHVVFKIVSVGQFDVCWQAYHKVVTDAPEEN